MHVSTIYISAYCLAFPHSRFHFLVWSKAEQFVDVT